VNDYAITTDWRLFSARLKAIQDGVKRGLIDPEVGTLPNQARLLTERAMELTPPKNQREAGAQRDRRGPVRRQEVGRRQVCINRSFPENRKLHAALAARRRDGYRGRSPRMGAQQDRPHHAPVLETQRQHVGNGALP